MIRASRIFGAVCAALLAIPAAAQATGLGYGDWLGEFARPSSGVTESEIEARTGDDVTFRGGWTLIPHDTAEFDFKITDTLFWILPVGGKWKYEGAETIDDLYLSIKYDHVYSIFHYESVDQWDRGLFSSDPDSTGMPMSQWHHGKPFPTLQVLMWSGDDALPTPIPVPGAIVLFSSALVGLFGLRQLRKGTTTA